MTKKGLKINWLMLALAIISLIGLVSISKYSDIKYFQGKRVAILGDSITSAEEVLVGQEFASLIEKDLGVDVFNFGKRWDTTSDALSRLKDVADIYPDVVVIILGGNDIIEDVPINETKENLEKIVEFFEEKEISIIICGLNSQYFFNYEKMFSGIAIKKSVSAFVPGLLNDVLVNINLAPDIVHPNGDGHRIIANRLLPHIRKVLLLE